MASTPDSTTHYNARHRLFELLPKLSSYSKSAIDNSGNPDAKETDRSPERASKSRAVIDFAYATASKKTGYDFLHLQKPLSVLSFFGIEELLFSGEVVITTVAQIKTLAPSKLFTAPLSGLLILLLFFVEARLMGFLSHVDWDGVVLKPFSRVRTRATLRA
jgi:hypothetical protein